ncbi:MAG: SDR family NAD(P)-dependent oxidoreductase [Bacteroidales bacterium]|nr:SDR family NAD(P)-dependent oxidoreductase [Bacteroidales bacterium]
MRKSTFKTILVTGASSGMGYEVAKLLATKGYKVYGAARRVALIEPLKEFGVTPVALDVCNADSIASCLAAVGDIDVLVNCAGYGSLGAIENVSLEEARRQMEVNVFGLAQLCKAVIPGMRERGYGRIVNIGSVVGRACLYFGGWYNVSKYAVEALSDCLRMELKPFGIDVVLVEPGAVKTDWGFIAADHLTDSSVGTPYEEAALREAAVFRKAFSLNYMTKPSRLAKCIVRAVEARRPRTRYHKGFGSRAMIFWHSVLPDRMWDAIMSMLSSPRMQRLLDKL